MNIAETFNTYIYQRPKTLVIFFCLLLFAHIVFTFCSFYGNDDIIYSKYAATIASGGQLDNNATDHYSLRWMCIVVTALFYKLFGVNAFSSALFSFSCFISTAVFIFKLIRNEDFLIKVLTLVLFFFNYTVIFYAHRLLPDAGVCLFVFVAYYSYHKQRFYSSSTIKNGIVFGVSMFLAAITKETIFITLPLWIYLFVTDMFRKRNYTFWLWSIAVFITLTFVYTLYFKITTNDWFYRYHLLQKVNISYGNGTGELSFTETLKRIGYTLWQSLLLNGDMQYLIPAITGVVYLKQVYKNEKVKHIAVCFLILLLCADLMTFSPTMYAPLIPDPRHFIFIIPFAVITAAYMLHAYMQEPQKYFLLLVTYLTADVFLFLSNIGNTKYIYVLITALLLLRWLQEYFHAKTIKAFCTSFAVIMFINFAFGFIVPRYPFYFDQKEIIQTFFSNAANVANVYTGDPHTAKMGEYFLEFKNKNAAFKNLASCNKFKNNEANYLLINGDYDAYFKDKTDSLMRTSFASNVKELKKINNSVLYQVKNSEALNTLKLFSTNDYKWR